MRNTLELGISSMLHDMGKVFVPAEIVKKPGKANRRGVAADQAASRRGCKSPGGTHGSARSGIDNRPRTPHVCQWHRLSINSEQLSDRICSAGSWLSSTPMTRSPRTDHIVMRWTSHQAIAWMLYEASDQYDRLLLARFAAHAQLIPTRFAGQS